MRSRITTLLLSSVATCLAASTSNADVTPYSTDFESLDPASPTALGDAGWLVFANVFDGMSGAYLYGYGTFPAPNGTPGFCSVATGQGGPPQGAQQLVTYSDYNNADHANLHLIETNVFQESIVGAVDVGKTYDFVFDAKLGDLVAPSTALGFIKVLDNVTFQPSAFVTVDMTNTPTTWTTYSLSTTLDASQVGHIFQIGFLTTSTNYTPSGVFYDNVNLFENIGGAGTPVCFGDGTGTPCPCNNTGAAGHGCGNGTFAGGALLDASGQASVSADTLVFSATDTTPSQPGLFFQGNNTLGGGVGMAFGDGLRCAGNNVIRLETVFADGTGTAATSVGIAGLAGLAAGDQRTYQWWYRDPLLSPCGALFNLSNAYEVVWQP